MASLEGNRSDISQYEEEPLSNASETDPERADDAETEEKADTGRKKRGRPLGTKNRTKARENAEQRKRMESFIFGKKGNVGRSPIITRTTSDLRGKKGDATDGGRGQAEAAQSASQQQNIHDPMGKNNNKKEDPEREWQSDEDSISMEQMFAGLERRYFQRVAEIKEGISVEMRKEFEGFKVIFLEEIERVTEEVRERENQWIIERQLLKTRIEKLEEKCAQQEWQEENVRQWIEDEVKRKISVNSVSIPEAQNEERLLKKIEAQVERIATEKSQEGADRALASIESKWERSERQARRANVIIRGAGFNLNLNLKREVEAFLDEKMEARVQIKRATALGRGEGNNGDTVLVHLGSLEEKQSIMRNRALLRGTRIYVDDDLTKTEREIHKQIWQRSKEEEEKGNKVKRGYMKLFVNNQCWKWNEKTNKLEAQNFRNRREESQ